MNKLNPLDLRQTVIDMCAGNPGAINVLMQIIQTSDSVDPDNVLGPLGPLSVLDELNVYGTEIWVLYKDVCGESLTTTLAVLRGYQLGLLSDKDIRAGLTQEYRSEGKDALRTKIEGIVDVVRTYAPSFAI